MRDAAMPLNEFVHVNFYAGEITVLQKQLLRCYYGISEANIISSFSRDMPYLKCKPRTKSHCTTSNKYPLTRRFLRFKSNKREVKMRLRDHALHHHMS